MISYLEICDLGFTFIKQSKRIYPDKSMDKTNDFEVFFEGKVIGTAKGIGKACDVAEAYFRRFKKSRMNADICG